MRKILVILGPTATGKTDVGLLLAKKFNGEIISADSRQVYTGLDLGTGKLPGHEVEVKRNKGYWEMDNIKVWMLDLVTPNTQYTVDDYIRQANRVIEDISKRGKLPILVGGTGHYIRALLEGLPNLAIPVDLKLREELRRLSLVELQKKLKNLDSFKWQSLNNSEKNNPRRLLRSIEMIIINPHTRPENAWLGLSFNYNILKIGLTAPRQVLNQRIHFRLISRINQGMIKEGEKLLEKEVSLERMQALGLEYRFLAEYLSGVLDKEQLIQELSTKIRQFAKRQLTWFKKEKDIHWFDITKEDYLVKVENLSSKWYDTNNV